MSKKIRSESFYAKYIKRLLDIIAAVALMICFWWLYMLCAIAIVIDTGLPVIYRQERRGKGGRQFMIYKFRTMVKNADQIGPSSTQQGDTRITKVGKFLRLTSLDELPQVFNILKGDMSLIGFRPDVYRENVDYSQLRYSIRPGITGYAQVNGRSLLSAEERERWNDLYPYDVSIWTDLKILAKTVCAVIKRTGTN